MSFPYTLDLGFGSEQVTADNIGRISFGTSGGGGGEDSSKTISFPLASRDYNFNYNSTNNEANIIWAHLENVTLDENAPQLVKDWWATKPSLLYSPWPITESGQSMGLYYEYADSSDLLEIGFLYNTHPNSLNYKFGYWEDGMEDPIIIITGDLVIDDPETWSMGDIHSSRFPGLNK